MALYLGSSEKLKINVNNAACYLHSLFKAPISNVALLSFDKYTLKDSNGMYLIPNNYNRSE